jgi:hypothetical protein
MNRLKLAVYRSIRSSELQWERFSQYSSQKVALYFLVRHEVVTPLQLQMLRAKCRPSTRGTESWAAYGNERR